MLLMEDKVPFFSIIIPVYNTKKFLPSCVDSVLSQTFKDFEMILVDDGSTDGSSDLCNSLAAENPSVVRVFHKENEGVIATRCFGVERTTGEFVLFLDADDCYRANALELVRKAIVDNSADIVMFDYSSDVNFSSGTMDVSFETNCVLEKRTVYREFFKRSINSIWNKAFARKLAPSKEHLSKYLDVKVGEDAIQTGCVLREAERIVYIDEVLYFYRQHEESVMHSYNPNALLYSCRVVVFFNEYLESLYFDNDTEREFQEIIDLSSVYDCCVSIASIVRKAGCIDVIPSEINYLYDAYRRCNKTKVKTVQRIEFFLFKRKCYVILLSLLKVWDGLKCKKV